MDKTCATCTLARTCSLMQKGRQQVNQFPHGQATGPGVQQRGAG